MAIPSANVTGTLQWLVLSQGLELTEELGLPVGNREKQQARMPQTWGAPFASAGQYWRGTGLLWAPADRVGKCVLKTLKNNGKGSFVVQPCGERCTARKALKQDLLLEVNRIKQ